ncbi:transcription factor 24-like [Paramormyrops kingsleyae]|uniref:Transcription factor 24-like n=1 Tax=Paramormyrops kingsleyae TaxID=1676925 RepID=A0A3B3T0V6_9TELE|nr:transcription factor 24-like [Paramormyrops kingsleyae]
MVDRHLDTGTSAATFTEIFQVEPGMLSNQGGMYGFRNPARRDPKKSGMSGSGIQSRVLRPQPSPENAARERSRVRNLRQAFRSLQAALPSVPPDTKLSKLDVLVLATNYIAHLSQTLDQGGGMTEHTGPCKAGGYLHPVKKWPMRSLLYCGNVEEILSGASTSQTGISGVDDAPPLTPDLGHRN